MKPKKRSAAPPIKRIMLLILVLILSFYSTIFAQTVNSWITSGDKNKLLEKQSSINFVPDTGTNPTTITIDNNTVFQTMDGFGFTVTEGSAEVISTLNTFQKNNLLTELFDPINGNNFSVIRISIGASDLSSSVYSYNEVSGDVSMVNFNLSGPDLTYLIPLLKDIITINPNIKIIATPWSAPTWMKTNKTWVGGSLEIANYAAYANYFVKYLDAMKTQGINIWAITPQNEPENPYNNPSMLMSSTEQTNFINNNLGPAIRNAGYSTKIIAFDHNCDNSNYPISVLNNSTYVDGAAFHLYAGDISAMSNVHNATGKNVYFTEQYTAIGGSFGGDLAWHLRNVVIGSTRNWSKTVLQWNLANDPNGLPHTPGGCDDCLGAITINNTNTYTRNVGYYIISHLSKFIKPNAVRISSTSFNSIENTAFRNPNGSIVVVAINNLNTSNTFKIKWGTQSFTYTLSAGAVATFKWDMITTALLKEKKENKKIEIFPNPSQNYLIIRQHETPCDINIYNAIGQLVYSNKNKEKEITIPTKKIGNKGVYFVKINTITSKLVIKN